MAGRQSKFDDRRWQASVLQAYYVMKGTSLILQSLGRGAKVGVGS